LRKQYDYSTNDFIIVMEDELEKANERRQMEKQVRNNLYAQTEKQREEINRLKEENKITEERYRELLQKVNKDEDDNETIIKDMVEKYSKIDFDQEDDFNRQFSVFLLNGEILRADSLLRTKGNIKDDIKNFKAFQTANAQKRGEQVVRDSMENRSKQELADRCYKYFELFKTQHQHDSATYYIEQRASLDTTNAEWQFDAGYYCQKQSQYNKAEDYYVRTLVLERRLAASNPQTYEAHLATTLGNMALLYSNIHRFTESEAMYKEALSICSRIAFADPQPLNESRLARILNNFGILYHYNHRFSESEAYYKEALKYRRRLTEIAPRTFESDMAQTLHNLAILYSNIQRFTESEAIFKELLVIRRRLAVSNPQAYESGLAATLNGIANLYFSLERYTESEEMFNEALIIDNRLAKINPQVYEHYVVEIYGKMSNLYLYMENYAKAEQSAKKSIALDSTQHRIASNLATALLLQGRYSEAEPIYRQYKEELKDSFLDDFEQFKAAGVIPKEREEDVEKIKRMLEE
jgi:tetratricopeptide (TPR) repeat protein